MADPFSALEMLDGAINKTPPPNAVAPPPNPDAPQTPGGHVTNALDTLTQAINGGVGQKQAPLSLAAPTDGQKMLDVWRKKSGLPLSDTHAGVYDAVNPLVNRMGSQLAQGAAGLVDMLPQLWDAVGNMGAAQGAADRQKAQGATPDQVQGAIDSEDNKPLGTPGRDFLFNTLKMPDIHGTTTAGKYFDAAIRGVPLSLSGIGLLPAIGGSVGAQAGGDIANSQGWGPRMSELAQLIGGTVGGVGTSLGQNAVGSMASGAANAMRGASAPYTAAGQARLATKQFRDQATDPVNVENQLNNPSKPLVPGSNSTTGQQTGDMGILSAERQWATKNPDVAQQLRADQNTARVSVLQGFKDGQADPKTVLDLFRQQRSEIENAGDVTNTANTAQGVAGGMKGNVPPEVVGGNMRGYLQEAANAAKSAESKLWNAIPRDATVDVGPLKQTLFDQQTKLSDVAKQFQTPAENAFIKAIGNMKDGSSFGELLDLRSQLSAAMRAEKQTAGISPAYARMAQLRGALEDRIENGIVDQVTIQNQAVAAGKMAPDATFATALEREVGDWRAAKAAKTPGGEDIGNPSAGAAGVRPASGAPGLQNPERGNASGGVGLDGRTGAASGATPAEIASSVRLASQATKDRVQTFNNGPVGQSLRGPMQGQYTLSNAAIPSKFLHGGPKGYEDGLAFRNAVGNKPEAIQQASDYLSGQAYKAAIGPNGVLDAGKLARFTEQYKDTLRAFPELADKLSNAQSVSQSAADAAVRQAQALKSFDASVAGKFLKAETSEDVTNTVGKMMGGQDATQSMRALYQQTKGSPNAVSGIRNSVAEWITNKFISNTEVGTSGQAGIRGDAFQTFMRDKKSALAPFFSPEEIKSMQAVADDLARANRSLNAVRIPGQSNTAQDLVPQLGPARDSIFGAVRMAMGNHAGSGVGAATGGTFGGAPGAIGGAIIGNFVDRLRQAGIDNANQLYSRMLVDPEFARVMLAKVPMKPGKDTALPLSRQLDKIAIFTAARGLSNTGPPDDGRH